MNGPGEIKEDITMKRFELVDYEEATPGVRGVYDDFLRSTGSTFVPIWVQSLGADEHLLRAYWERTKGSLVYGKLPAVLKEMVVFAVSVHNGARYCSAAHAHTLLSLDPTLSYDHLLRIVDPEAERADLPGAYRVAIDFAVLSAKNPDAITDAHYEALQEADFTDEEVRELQSVIDLAQMFNSYSRSLQLPLDPEFRPILQVIGS